MEHDQRRARGKGEARAHEARAASQGGGTWDASLSFQGLLRVLAASGSIAAGRDLHVAVNVEIVLGRSGRARCRRAARG